MTQKISALGGKLVCNALRGELGFVEQMLGQDGLLMCATLYGHSNMVQDDFGEAIDVRNDTFM